MDDHGALLLEHLLHALLVGCKLNLSLLRVDIQVVVVRCIPPVLLLWLDLLVDQFDHESGQRMVVKMTQKTVEDLALLVEKQVLKRRLLLLVEQLLHDLQEVAS